MTLQETSFEDAVLEFRKFLTDNGLTEPILWVFEEDIFSRRTDTFEKDFWLKIPLPEENEEFARRHFELGKHRGFGLGLSAFARCDEGLCCSFIVPTDDEDAQYMLLGPEHLKYSFVSRDMPVAKVVRSEWSWWAMGWLRRFFKPGCHFVYLASKGVLRRERFLALIRSYQTSVAEAALLFERHKGIPASNLAGARFEGLGAEGHVNPEGTIAFHYHGIGLCVEYPDRTVDWDFGHDGRMDGFDAFRLWVYAESGAEGFREFRRKQALQDAFEDAERRGDIHQPFRRFRDDLYYLPEVR
jgi:hypothetical protein